MVGLGRQHPPITSLGLGKSSRLMVLEAGPKELGGLPWHFSRIAQRLSEFGGGAALLAVHKRTLSCELARQLIAPGRGIEPMPPAHVRHTSSATTTMPGRPAKRY